MGVRCLRDEAFLGALPPAYTGLDAIFETVAKSIATVAIRWQRCQHRRILNPHRVVHEVYLGTESFENPTETKRIDTVVEGDFESAQVLQNQRIAEHALLAAMGYGPTDRSFVS